MAEVLEAKALVEKRESFRCFSPAMVLCCSKSTLVGAFFHWLCLALIGLDDFGWLAGL